MDDNAPLRRCVWTLAAPVTGRWRQFRFTRDAISDLRNYIRIYEPADLGRSKEPYTLVSTNILAFVLLVIVQGDGSMIREGWGVKVGRYRLLENFGRAESTGGSGLGYFGIRRRVILTVATGREKKEYSNICSSPEGNCFYFVSVSRRLSIDNKW